MLKVLIVSHNPITTYDAMGKTMASFFSGFRKEQLCQLYIYPTIPDIDFCSSYFRVTDKDVLKSYASFAVKGREIAKSEIDTDQHAMFENPSDEATYRNQKNKTPLRMLLRDVMWKCARWYNRAMRTWLAEQAPTCMFVAPGTAEFLYDIALKIARDYRIPIISYICDEYYFVKKPTRLLEKIRVGGLRKKIAKLMSKTAHVVTICDSLCDLYAKEFSVPATVIMTGAAIKAADQPAERPSPRAITYMGNIRCNRYFSLAEIGRVLQQINRENRTDFSLKIYTGEKDPAILAAFDGISSIELCGFVSGEEFERVFRGADILLHTEAFDEESIDLVKHSVSTKIADSLASGIPLLAYGPASVASMRHLIDHDCAVTVTDKGRLADTLNELFFNAERRKTVTENALKTAKAYHDAAKASLWLKEIVENLHEGITS